jgi:hypothetical protein
VKKRKKRLNLGACKEPYRNLSSVRSFDETIRVCLIVNNRTAPLTKIKNITDLQVAACEIIPSGISLALSVRELVREGYLYGALVMIRPLVERAIIIQYLEMYPEKIEIWKRGWQHKERPSLYQMLNEISENDSEKPGGIITPFLNSLTHGDPASVAWNIVKTGEGTFGNTPSKLLKRPDVCDIVCNLAESFTALLMSMMILIFPDQEDNSV